MLFSWYGAIMLSVKAEVNLGGRDQVWRGFAGLGYVLCRAASAARLAFTRTADAYMRNKKRAGDPATVVFYTWCPNFLETQACL